MFFGHKHRRHGMQHGRGSEMGSGFGFGGGSELGGEGRGRHGRGGSRRRMFDASALRLILLRLIEQEPRHGYDLIREIEELSGGVYAPSPGVIYPTLTLLAEMGFIEEAAQEGSRKQFAITAAGSANLAEHHDAVELTLDRLRRLGEDGVTADHTPVLRALDNLNAVLRHRLSREGAGVTTILDVAALIDEAAQKIERL
jgi:DNA-binding PadR family transcriptional regulator